MPRPASLMPGAAFSKRTPSPPHAFLSHQADDFGTDLCCVEFLLAMSKPHDDFCGLLAIGVYPQIKIGNDLIESLEEKRNRLRLEGSAVIQHAL